MNYGLCAYPNELWLRAQSTSDMMMFQSVQIRGIMSGDALLLLQGFMEKPQRKIKGAVEE